VSIKQFYFDNTFTTEAEARDHAIVGGRRMIDEGTVSAASDVLILDLTRQETARALQHRLRSYLRPSLLAIDEVGYLAYDAHAADLLFQVVSRRYEQKSIVITTNL
jgi:hypothetical protein